MLSKKRTSRPSLFFPHSVDELFQQFWGEPCGTPTRATKFAPRIDVLETDDTYVVTAELPGVDAADVEVSLADDTLTIEGEKKTVEATETDKGHITERTFGAFKRQFSFPSAVTADDVAAESKRGVLTVTVKKAAAGTTRRIEIQGE